MKRSRGLDVPTPSSNPCWRTRPTQTPMRLEESVSRVTVAVVGVTLATRPINPPGASTASPGFRPCTLPGNQELLPPSVALPGNDGRTDQRTAGLLQRQQPSQTLVVSLQLLQPGLLIQLLGCLQPFRLGCSRPERPGQ